MIKQPALELRIEMEKPMEHRYRITGIRTIEAGAVVTLEATEAAGFALAPYLFQEVRILPDSEGVGESRRVSPTPPEPPKPSLRPVWEAVFPGLECGERADGTLWHQLSSGADDHEAMLTLHQDTDVWRVSLKGLVERGRLTTRGPADVVVFRDAGVEELRGQVERAWHKYIARYSEGELSGGSEIQGARWVPARRKVDLWTVRYVERALRGMD